MVERIPSNSMLVLKAIGYWCWLIPVALILVSYPLSLGSAHPDAWAFLVPGVIFGLIPLLDALIGRDSANLREDDQVQEMGRQAYYRFVTLVSVPLLLGVLVWSGWVLFHHETWSWLGKVGWTVSVGVVMGGTGITIAHELIHKDPAIERNGGGLLLAAVCYGGFKVDHVRGHHVNVSTPEDASSARYGQSLYRFLPHAYKRNFLNAWKLEAERLQRKGLRAFSMENELIGWYGLSAAFLIGFTVAYGWRGAVFFLAQSFIGMNMVEVTNYVEHYGLHRRKLANGRYERTTLAHSWNSNHLLTNLLLFQLQRHSDHHAYANRRYQVLRHHEDSPQLPNGFPGMAVVALIPPLWFAVMNPKVRAYYAGEEHQLGADQQPT